MVQSNPDRYTAALSKKARKGRIFIDYLRNSRGATTVAPLSLRANPAAAISMPIAWSDLTQNLTPQTFTIGSEATLQILKKPDPWASFFKMGKPLRG